MPKQNVHLHSFAVGVQDKKNLVRVDLERMRLAAEDQTNFMASTTGNMVFRPGTQYLGTTRSNANSLIKDFIFGSNDAALMEFTSNRMRVWVNDTLVTRPAVTASVNQGDFGGTGSWVLTADSGATCTISGNRLRMSAPALGAFCRAKQQVTVNEPNVEHALNIKVVRGPVTFRCGSTSGGDEYITETQLREGRHSLAFTPTGSSFWIFFETGSETNKIIETCEIESSGDMQVVTPWGVGILDSLRFAQSGDVVFVASSEQQYRIERRGSTSWSVVKYLVDDGPFMTTKSANVRLKPSVTRGNGTLTASGSFFTSAHVGAIFKLTHPGQQIVQSLADDYQYTDPIKVTGIHNSAMIVDDRYWVYSVSGTWAGTLNWYRSFDGEFSGYRLFRKETSSSAYDITGNVSDITNDDGDDNAIIWYKLGFENSYTSGSADITITYTGGGDYGICRVTAYNSKTSVDIEILRPFKATIYTEEWVEGVWSDEQGWPTSVAFAEGRLWWAGADRFWASVSDAYESFDEETIGDSAPINRSIADGGVNDVQWMMNLQRLVFGTAGCEVSAKSSSLDEPLTATNMSLRAGSTIGSAALSPVKIDTRGIFVDRSQKGLFELLIAGNSNDYSAAELTRLCAGWFSSGIVSIGVQRRPDTRIWAVLGDGSAMCIVYEPAQEIAAFIPVTTDGTFTRVAVLPGIGEDIVYFSVTRTLNGSTRRTIERLGRMENARPTTQAWVGDCAVVSSNGSPSTTISGLDHLIGESVKVWADGAPFTEVISSSSGDITIPKLYTVNLSGQITVDRAVTSYVVGLPYKARYKSSRLAYGAAQGTALLQRKKVTDLGLILTDYVRSGITYGQEFDNAAKPLFPLPVYRDGFTADEVVRTDVIDEDPLSFLGEWGNDSRVCIQADWPVNVLSLVIGIDTNG